MQQANPEPEEPPTSSSNLLRFCGSGAVLAGMLFVVWGYLDRPNIPIYLEVAVQALSFMVPALFLMGLVGIYFRCKREANRPAMSGLALAFIGSGLGILPLSGVADWFATLLGGLTLAGIATAGRSLRGLGALLLATATLGWTYYFTDSGAVFEARSIHVGFGVLFSLGWVALGLALWVGGTRQAKGAHA